MTIDKNDLLNSILASISRIDYVKSSDIPNIDLYMDQVTTFMDEHLSKGKRFSDDKILTKTMINNYTKNQLLPPPNKKKYSKDHMLLLVFIYYFKNILSINDIRSIFQPLTEMFANNEEYDKNNINLETIYTEVFGHEKEQAELLTKDLIRKFKTAESAFEGKVENEEEKELLMSFTFICTLAFDVYIKKTMIEKIIDQRINPQFSKEKAKEKGKDK